MRRTGTFAVITFFYVSRFCIKSARVSRLEFYFLCRLPSEQHLRAVFWWSDFSRDPWNTLNHNSPEKEKNTAYRTAVGGRQSLTAPSQPLLTPLVFHWTRIIAAEESVLPVVPFQRP